MALPFFTGILKGGASVLRSISEPGDYQVTQGGHASFLDKTRAQGKGSNPVRDWVMRHFSSSAGGIGAQTANESPYVAGRTMAGQSMPLVLNMDGRKVGEIVSFHQGTAMNGPQIGPSGFDSRMSIAPAGGY